MNKHRGSSFQDYLKENPVMHIEKPEGFFCGEDSELFDQWWDEAIVPLNKMLSEAVGMSGCADKGDNYLYFDSVASEGGCKPASHHTHTALLINPKEIKKETAEDLLKKIVHHTIMDHRGGVNVGTNPDFNKCIDRARKLWGNNP